MLLVSVLTALYKNSLPPKILLKHQNCTVEMTFGNLFRFPGFKVIPASRYLYEVDVIRKSLQGQLINRFQVRFGESEWFSKYQNILSTSLINNTHDDIYREYTGKYEKYYPLGTTGLLHLDNQKYLIFSLTETELRGAIGSDNCNVSKMWDAMDGLWRTSSILSRGETVNLPLIGSGFTDIRLSTQQILELNLLSIINSIEKYGHLTSIRIVIHPKFLGDLDLSSMQKLWK